MRAIKLENCHKVRELPPMGKLPVLEKIQIGNMASIECVGEEFYGKERGAFPSLKILKFERMQNWSIWSYPAGDCCGFACLQELHVIDCPNLLMSLPDGISLQILQVFKCYKLLVALPRTSILEMYIGGCKVELMECLKEDGDASRLNIENADVIEAVESARIISNKDVVEAHRQMMMLGSLTALEMTSIPQLTHLPGVVLQGLPKLEKLSIRCCEELLSLSKMDDGEMEIGGLILHKQKSHFLNSLLYLEVEECPQLVCLVPQRGEEEGANRDTDISEKEEKRGKQQYLGLPCGLEVLMLKGCYKLEKLPSNMHSLTSLRYLEIQRCSLTEISFPSTLESLEISGCELLTCLSSSSSSSLPEELYSSSLKSLLISSCENLGELSISLPHLSALEYLEISGRPAGLLSIQQGGPNSLPPNLRTLNISGRAGGPNDEQLFSVPLPSSLTELIIHNFKKLSPEAFQNLTSLQELSIRYCPELTSIPGQLLPPSLRSLEISGCPLLEPEFEKDKGRYWPKVKFIHSVRIGYRATSDTEEE